MFVEVGCWVKLELPRVRNSEKSGLAANVKQHTRPSVVGETTLLLSSLLLIEILNADF